MTVIEEPKEVQNLELQTNKQPRLVYKEEVKPSEKSQLFDNWIRNIISYLYYENCRVIKDSNTFKNKLYDLNWNILPSFEVYFKRGLVVDQRIKNLLDKVDGKLDKIILDVKNDQDYFAKFCELNAYKQFFLISKEYFIPEDILSIYNIITKEYFSNNSSNVVQVENKTTFTAAEFIKFKDKCKETVTSYMHAHTSNPQKKYNYEQKIKEVFSNHIAINELINSNKIGPNNIDPKVLIKIIDYDFVEDNFEDDDYQPILDSSPSKEDKEEKEEYHDVKLPVYNVTDKNIHDAIVCMLHYKNGLFLSTIKKHLKTNMSDKQLTMLIHNGADTGRYNKCKSKEHFYMGKPVDQFYSLDKKRQFYFIDGENYTVKSICSKFNIYPKKFYRNIKSKNHIQVLNLSSDLSLPELLQE